MFVCIYVKHSKTNISILCIFSMYAKDDNKDNNKIISGKIGRGDFIFLTHDLLAYSKHDLVCH